MSQTKITKAQTLEEALNVINKDALSSSEVIDAFYVDTNKVRYVGATADPVKMMAIAIRTAKSPCHILFSGHIGCGKSTELKRLEKMLTEQKYLVSIAECHIRLNLNAMEYTDVMLFVLETLLDCAIMNDLAVNEKPLRRIQNYWGTELTKVSTAAFEATAGIHASIEAETPSLLKRIYKIVAGLRAELLIQSNTRAEFQQKVQPELHTFIAMINEVISDIQNAGVKKGFKNTFPIILQDGLEKANMDVADRLFERHSQDLVRMHAHLVMTFPINLCYKPGYVQIKNNFANDWRLPMIKLRTWNGERYTEYPGGIKTLSDIVEKRMERDLFEGDTLKCMIVKTGGSLRDLFEVLYTAALNALGEDRTIITQQDAEAALNKMTSGISERFPQNLIPKLIEIIDGKKSYASDEDLMVLLQSSAVLEYNGERWVDVHPLAAEWIKNTQIAGKAF